LLPATTRHEIILREWAEIAGRDTIAAAKVTIAVETAAATEAGIVDAGDADVGGGGAEEAVEAVIAGIRAAAAICHLRNTHRHRANGIRAVTITGGHRGIAVRVLRRQWNRGKTTSCCRASLWRSIAGDHSRSQ
jgi:hypothetical protein